MPELPEVETMRRGLLAVAGTRIKDIQLAPCHLRPISIQPTFSMLRKGAIGQEILDVGRIGKRVILHLANGSGIVFEPRMTGLLLVADAPDEAHLRLRVDTRGGPIKRFWFWDRRGLGVVRWLTAAGIAENFGSHRIGPDALECSVAEWNSRLGNSSRPIKVALLDQKVAAGIGNLYAAEILYAARIHPATPCKDLSMEQWKGIRRATVKILSQAIEHEGSTLSDETYRTALNRHGDYQNLHRVYQKEGRICRRCRQGTILRIVQAQRATFFCPVCQPPGRVFKAR
jgi:formamidopyrimidine-DNA glycosylase